MTYTEGDSVRQAALDGPHASLRATVTHLRHGPLCPQPGSVKVPPSSLAAHTLGCDVTAISSSPGKKEQALVFGAARFIVVGGEVSMQQCDYYSDLLLCTAHGEVDWESLLMTLRKKGRLVLLGLPRLPFRPIDLVAHELSITGSFIGSRATMREMLSFAHAQGIVPQVELMPMSEVNEAILRAGENCARYRVVLINDTAGAGIRDTALPGDASQEVDLRGLTDQATEGGPAPRRCPRRSCCAYSSR